ncbi:hypothetical protein A0H81_10617 [Grifola frondosa]|uniref:Uncharacterized protein n=1 Tax=Grifola frondosa TaxID=5627 RepID=A0A1C7LY43_GRIFR|nr:hypothetical protein A0H81_10617 [Grifola frondosa]
MSTPCTVWATDALNYSSSADHVDISGSGTFGWRGDKVGGNDASRREVRAEEGRAGKVVGSRGVSSDASVLGW